MFCVKSLCFLKATYGKVIIDEAKKTCVWDIGRIPKENSPHLEGKIHFAGGGEKICETKRKI